MSDLRVRIYKARGRYNLLSNEHQEQVAIFIKDGDESFGVSETWDEGEAPDISSMSLAEVADEIADRANQYWISTSREETLANCERIKNEPRYTIQWLRQQAICEQEKAAKAHFRAAHFLSELADLCTEGNQ